MAKQGGRPAPKAALPATEIEEDLATRTPTDLPAEDVEAPPVSTEPEEQPDAASDEEAAILALVNNPNGPFATPVEDEDEPEQDNRYLREVLQPQWLSKGLKLCPICGWVVNPIEGRCAGSPKEHGQFRTYAPKPGTIYNPHNPSAEEAER